VALHLSPGHLRAEMNKTASGAGNGPRTAHEFIIETSRGAHVGKLLKSRTLVGTPP